MSSPVSRSARPRGTLFGWRRDLALAILFLAALSLVVERLNRPEEFGRSGAVAVHDGDTLTLAGERIRLLDIDAPELRQVCRRDGKKYPCGEVSRDALIALIGGRPVACEAEKRDRYRRLLGECRAGGVDLNIEQVRSGWAVAYGGKLKAEETAARERGVGLWAGSFENPKEWRQRRGAIGDLEFGPLAELFVRLGEVLGLVSPPDWQREGDAIMQLMDPIGDEAL